jgi:hypothetical protein
MLIPRDFLLHLESKEAVSDEFTETPGQNKGEEVEFQLDISDLNYSEYVV